MCNRFGIRFIRNEKEENKNGVNFLDDARGGK